MCGIAGAFRHDGRPDPGLVTSMLAGLSHRGPDGGGFVVTGGAALGHRRLAIHDLSPNAFQPFIDEATGVAVVVNGEIYDADALRARLEARGYTFRSGSDSELVLPLWFEHGLDFTQLLSGPFALALVDPRTNLLVLARDRLGKKPLFWTAHEGTIVFASELAALAQAVPPSWNDTVLPEYLRQGYVAAPATPFAGVHAVEPGTRVIFDSGAHRIDRWWNPPLGTRDDWDAESAALALETELGRAVRRRLAGDRSIGVLLSGGLDSAAVLALAHETSSADLRAFTLSFPDAPSDEAALARATAAAIGVPHEVIPFDVDPAALLQSLIAQSGELLADSSWLAFAALCRAVSPQATVLLTGDGGDEVLLGYRRHRAARFAAMVPAFVHPLGRAAAAACRSREWRKRWVTFSGSPREVFADQAGLAPWSSFSRWLLPDVARREDPLLGLAARVPPQPDAAADAGRIDLLTYLPGDLLPKADRGAMASGAETRAPFLDDEVVALGLSMPGTIRASAFAGKLPLRRLLRDRLPRELLEAPKRGFAVPLAAWLRQGPLAQLTRTALHDIREPFAPYLLEGSALPILAAFDRGEPVADLLFACLVAALHWQTFGRAR